MEQPSQNPSRASMVPSWLGACAFIGLFAAGTQAQTVQEKLNFTHETIETQRRVLVSGAVPLTEEEARDFWPIYDDYEKKRRTLDERETRLVTAYVASVATLTDLQAKQMLAEAVAMDEHRVKLRREVLDRLGKVIPVRKVARFYQIDSKLDSVVRAEISRQIPFVP
jgi:hypothetical protein